MSADELIKKAERYREYFKVKGGITVSGGEPLCQAEFCKELFTKAKLIGINTCLDTSGCVLNDEVKALLEVTDLVLLDVKYTTDEDYQKFVGCELSAVLEFLEYLQAKGKRTWIRQVIIPGLNDDVENIKRLKAIVSKFSVVEKTELLPFKKLCETKYDELNLVFLLKDTPEASKSRVEELQLMLNL
jgi:pyruvate formate lyase activating enzyme